MLLITKHNRRTELGRTLKDTIEEKAKLVGAQAYKTVIRESVAIKEAQLAQKSIYGAMSNNAVTDYFEFVAEYIKRGVKNG